MSKIKFLKEMFIECCIGFDDFGDPIMEEEKVLKGEEFEVDIVSDEVDEDISLEEKIEKYDDNYDIRFALSGAENDVASGEYVNYLRNTLKSALQEYGSVFEFNDEKIKIQIDLKDYLDNFNEDEIDEFYENCNEIPACVFDELLNVDFITKPKPRFNDNWYPDIDKTEYNQLLRERLNEI